MENLHQYIKQLWEDYTLPSARGQATDRWPDLWEEEAIFDNKILHERLAKRLSRRWVAPDPDDTRCFRNCAPAPKPKDEGLTINKRLLRAIMSDFIYGCPWIAQPSHSVESVLARLAQENGWENIWGRIYKIR